MKTEATKLKNAIIDGLLESKGIDITEINLIKIDHAVCQYFVLCTGSSNTHVDALAHNTERYVREHAGQKVWRKEGLENSQWIILDYVDVVVHIFQREYREFYGLEQLWADAPHVSINES